MQKNSQLRVLGMMSGTSLDGLDLVLCRFQSGSGKLEWVIEAAETVGYPQELMDRINQVFEASARDLARLDSDLGHWMGQQARQFLEKNGTADLISSHGHTIFHDPSANYTFQAGKGSAIVAETGIPTVSDLRSMDVAAGGQGAPLVPIGDELLFANYAACLNLGGFANISFAKKGIRQAFDICPVNFLLNRVANSLGHEYDKGGELARSGQLLPELLEKLEQLPFYQLEGPRSLGREQVEVVYAPLMQQYQHQPLDLLHTLTQHIAQQLAKIMHANLEKGQAVLLSGGGAFNAYLLELVQERSHVHIEVASAELINFKEGLIFALLGYLRVHNTPNALTSVTGARIPTIGGALYGDFSRLF